MNPINKNGHKFFFKEVNKPIIYKFFKDFTNHTKKTIRVVDFAVYFSPTLLNTGTLEQSGTQDPSDTY